MTNSLLHFENGVPIDDLALRADQKRRLTRVSHVYWLWLRNPYTVDYKALLRQLVKQAGFADAPSECHAAQKDVQLFEFIKESVSLMSRKEAQLKVQVAAERMVRIGMETDNVMALDKGSKRIFELAGLDKPEDQRQDMSKVMFLPPVVTTNVADVDPSRKSVTDGQTLAIINKYQAHQDGKRLAIEDRVNAMMARHEAEKMSNEEQSNEEP